MKISSILYICVAAATFSSLTNTAGEWYESTVTVVHSQMKAIEEQFLRIKAMYIDGSKALLGRIKSEITKRDVHKPYHSLKDFLKNMKSYVYKGREIVKDEKEEEKKSESKEEEKDEL